MLSENFRDLQIKLNFILMIDNAFFQNRPISHSIYPNHPEYKHIDGSPQLLHHPISYDPSHALIKHSPHSRRLAPQTLTKSYQFQPQELSPTKYQINQNNESIRNNRSFCPSHNKLQTQPLRINFKYSQCMTCGNPIEYHSHIISNHRQTSARSIYREELPRADNGNNNMNSDLSLSPDYHSESQSSGHQNSQQNVGQFQQLQNKYTLLNTKLQSLQTELKERDEKVDFLQEEMQAKIQIIGEKEQMIEEIFESMKNLQKKCQEQKIEKQELIEEKSVNQREISEIRNCVLQLESKLTEKEQLNKKQQEQINTYRSQLTLMVQKQQEKYNSDKYYQCKKQKHQLMDDLEKRDKKITKQLKSLEELTSQVAVLKEDNRKMHESHAKLENLYNEKKKELDSFKNIPSSEIQFEPQMINDHYEKQISELNQIIKEKNKQIQMLKASIKRLEAKIEQIEDNYMSHNQLTTLHKQINDCENKILADGGTIFDKLNNTTHSYFNGKVFEDLLIYELKKDNMRLLKKLGKVQGGSIGMNDKINYKRLESYEKSGKMPQSISLEAIQKIQTLVQDIFSKISRLLMIEELPKTQEVSNSKKKKEKKQNEALLYYNLENELRVCGMGLSELSEYLQFLMGTNQHSRVTNQRRQNRLIMT